MSQNNLNLDKQLFAKLGKQVSDIDIKGIYPEELVREFAKLDAYKLIDEHGVFHFGFHHWPVWWPKSGRRLEQIAALFTRYPIH